jgi:hypothetical protein
VAVEELSSDELISRILTHAHSLRLGSATEMVQ